MKGISTPDPCTVPSAPRLRAEQAGSTAHSKPGAVLNECWVAGLKRSGKDRVSQGSPGPVWPPMLCGEVLVDALFTLKPARQELKVSLHIRAL